MYFYPKGTSATSPNPPPTAPNQAKEKPKAEEKPKGKQKDGKGKGPGKGGGTQKARGATTAEEGTAPPATKGTDSTTKRPGDSPEKEGNEADQPKDESDGKGDVIKDGVVECAIDRWMIMGPRSANPDGRFQVVAEATQESGVSSDLYKSLKGGAEFIKLYNASGRSWKTMGERIKEKEGLDKAEKAGMKKFDREWDWEFKQLFGGNKELDLKPKTACAKGHEIVRSGGGMSVLKLAPEEQLPVGVKFEDTAKGATSASSKPSVYTVTVKNCNGEARNLTVEVFPSTQRMCKLGLSLKHGPLGKITEFINKTLKFTGKGELDVKLYGEFSAHEGWVEDEKSWKVYFVREAAAGVGFGVGLAFKVSLVEIATGGVVPASLAEYIADVTASLGFEGSLSVEGEIKRKAWNVGAAETEGSIGLKAKFGVPVKIGANVGPQKLVGAAVVGEAKPEITAFGGVGYEEETWMLKGDFKLSKCEPGIKVLTKAGVWEWRKEWKWVWWNEKVIWEGKYPLSKKPAEAR